MIITFWHDFLYRPLFNLLIFLYNNFSFNNLGVAIIYLTIIIRILLIPFSIMSDKGRSFYKMLAEKIKEIDKDYGSDYIKKKEAVRELLRQNRVNPWSRAVVLGVQLVVLILLYQVFVSGINAKEKADLLYTFIPKPDFVNTHFLWFSVDKKDWGICLLAGLALFIEISLVNSIKREIISRKEQIFRIVFPIFTVFALMLLPSVKAIFILTSLLFSIILIVIVDIIIESFKTKKTQSAAKKPPTIDLNDINIKKVS